MTAPALGPETPVEIHPEVLSRELDGETVVLHTERGTYFALDEVGTRIWELLGQGRPLGEVHAALLEHYEVGGEELWRDLVELVGELLEHGLVRVGSPSP